MNYCYNCDPLGQKREPLPDLVERKAREALGFGKTDEAIALLRTLVELKSVGIY